LKTDLIDEFRFIVEPFVMGTGKRFFPDGTLPIKLKLRESKTLESGSLGLIYSVINK
jgi:dihydrofolate reductase